MILIAILLLVSPQQSFTKFSFCHDSSRGPYESQCIDLDSQGVGEARLKMRGGDETKAPVTLSDSGRNRFIALLAATDFLANAANYESGKKVADLGLKKLVLETPSGRREGTFNFSTIKEVTELATFFDALLNQEVLLQDIDTALRFDRLSIPKRLDQIEAELRANRIGDPPRLAPILEKIEADGRLVNFARTRAGRIKQQLPK
jgi:hypothetical protein